MLNLSCLISYLTLIQQLKLESSQCVLLTLTRKTDSIKARCNKQRLKDLKTRSILVHTLQMRLSTYSKTKPIQIEQFENFYCKSIDRHLTVLAVNKIHSKSGACCSAIVTFQLD